MRKFFCAGRGGMGSKGDSERRSQCVKKEGVAGCVCLLREEELVGTTRGNEWRGREVRKDKMYRNEMENGFGWDLGLSGWI